MELALSLGNTNKLVQAQNICMETTTTTTTTQVVRSSSTAEIKQDDIDDDDDDDDDVDDLDKRVVSSSSSDPTALVSPPHLHLDLLPFSPLPHRPSSLTTQPPPLRFPWLSDNLSSEPGSSDGPETRKVEVNRRQAVDGGEHSSPNSETSSFMEFSLYNNNNNNNNNNNWGGGKKKGNNNNEGGGNYMEGVIVTTSRGSDDDENGSTRKKLRLSKEQSAFLEESFKEHHTLNPKQKQALAKELNLRPRQVEVWFQNRRARTKLKQTEVDCEYLKRCCETLTEENRRLQKELHDLRALKSSQPFFMQHPATTLTMCPSCERVGPTSTSAASTPAIPVATAAATPSSNGIVLSNDDSHSNGVTLSLGEPKPTKSKSMLPFANNNNPQAHQAAS